MKTILLMRHSIPEKSSKFVTDPGLSPIVYNMEELRKVLTYDKLAEPLMEHLRRSYQYTLNHRGPHGLPLIGRADWNDCLNLNCFSKTPGEQVEVRVILGNYSNSTF